jgi:hypothetical protein
VRRCVRYLGLNILPADSLQRRVCWHTLAHKIEAACFNVTRNARSGIAGAPATEHACQLIADVALVAIISELVPELYMDAPQNELISSMN